MGLFSKKNKNKAIQKSWQRKNPGSYSGREKPKKNGTFSRFLFWVLLFGFLGICAYLLLFSPFLDIERVSIEGNRDISGAEIASVVEKSFDGKIFGYLPRSNFFLVSEKNINDAVRNNFNGLEIESIEKKFPEDILVKVTERKTKLVWCSGGACYSVDEEGLAYGGAAATEEELRSNDFLTIIDDSARPVEIGKTKISPAYVGYLSEIRDIIRGNMGLEPAEGWHTPGLASGEVSVRTQESWILKLNSEMSAGETKKIIETVFEKELDPEKRKNLEYLDLRIKGKVYYKLKAQD